MKTADESSSDEETDEEQDQVACLYTYRVLKSRVSRVVEMLWHCPASRLPEWKDDSPDSTMAEECPGTSVSRLKNPFTQVVMNPLVGVEAAPRGIPSHGACGSGSWFNRLSFLQWQ